MDTIHQAEYNIRGLGTRAVILFPTRAQIFRDIKSIPLKPGANEIIVNGLSPTVDEHSIKVEGNGAATITDIAVELLPNRELFEDMYPDTDSDSDDNEGLDSITGGSQGLTDEEELAKLYPEIRAAKDHVKNLQEEYEESQEVIGSALTRLAILDTYNRTLDDKNQRPIEESLAVYKEERAKVFRDKRSAEKKAYDANTALAVAVQELNTLLRKKGSAKAKEDKAKQREAERKQRLRDEKRKEKERIKKERQGFWPKLCYTVRIMLEVNAFTPISSRRASVSSDITLPKEFNPVTDKSHDKDPSTCDLTLSYVTTSAYWSPNYDLQLSTTSSTGTLCFDAQLNNSTSETWEDCKVTLSTSQASFTGIEEVIPVLEPWNIKLATKVSGNPEMDVYESRQEITERGSYKRQLQETTVPKRRADIFGINEHSAPRRPAHDDLAAQQDYQMQLMILEQQNKKRLKMARQEQQVLSHAANENTQAAADPVQQFYSIAEQFGGQVNTEAYDALGEAATLAMGQDPLDFEESFVGETGLTTTYDLPGLKTLVPKSAGSKQRVARISFQKVIFSHATVPKYKPVVYLRARLYNTSKLTLLRGPAGLTLDGSFMGRTTIPRCSPGDSFRLSLGVDPAIKVSYPKPEVRRTTTGVFNKEDSSIYVRTITVRNTRPSESEPVRVLVQDQVPISEDERLKVPIITPRGLTVEGDPIATGMPGRSGAADKVWGSAEARLEKSGTVSWTTSLNAGKAVRLVLEYAVAVPSGEQAVQ